MRLVGDSGSGGRDLLKMSNLELNIQFIFSVWCPVMHLSVDSYPLLNGSLAKAKEQSRSRGSTICV